MYQVSRVGTDDLSLRSCASMLSASFPNAARFTPAFLEWQYEKNPAGHVVGYNAIAEDGTIAAHYVCLPIVASVDGIIERGLLSLNTATHPNHQGKGLFTRLASATYDTGTELGFGFVVGVANQNSTGGFVRKLGFDLVAPLHAKIGIGTLRSGASGEGSGFRRHWDEESLAWRVSNPAASYSIRGPLISCDTGRPLIDAVIGNSPFAEHLQTSSRIQRPFHLWIGRDPQIERSNRFFYRDIPQWLRPSPLNFIYRDLTKRNRKVDGDRLSFWTVDFDAY